MTSWAGMVGSSELSELLRMNPQQTLILEQRRRANCLNKNMRKLHENRLPLEMRLNSISHGQNKLLKPVLLDLHVFWITLKGLSIISMQFLEFKGYDFESLLRPCEVIS